MGYNLAKIIMNKIVILIIIAFMPFVSMGSKGSKIIKSYNLTEEVKLKNADNDWTPVGTTEIVKRVGSRNAGANTALAKQTVQVYRNSDGARAIKDGNRYSEIVECSIYGQFPTEDCVECGYRFRVLYRGEFWYTDGIVKKTYGSY